MQINYTQMAGLLAFVPAALAAAAAFGASRRRKRGRRGDWGTLAVIHAVFAVDIVTLVRYTLHNTVDRWLKAAGMYAERSPAQIVLLVVFVGMVVCVAAYWLRRAPTPQLILARAATAMLLALIVVETISLHATDAILFYPVGPVLLIGWVWLALGWTTTAAALAAIRR